MYKILIADDDPRIREILRVYFKKADFEVIEAEDGQQALTKVEKEKPNIVLLDIMMPVMDGLTATKTIRSLERQDAKTIPIIAMTANAFREDAEKCMEAGMNAHLAKPLDDEKIKQTISEELRKQNACHE